VKIVEGVQYTNDSVYWNGLYDIVHVSIKYWNWKTYWSQHRFSNSCNTMSAMTGERREPMRISKFCL